MGNCVEKEEKHGNGDSHLGTIIVNISEGTTAKFPPSVPQALSCLFPSANFSPLSHKFSFDNLIFRPGVGESPKYKTFSSLSLSPLHKLFVTLSQPPSTYRVTLPSCPAPLIFGLISHLPFTQPLHISISPTVCHPNHYLNTYILYYVPMSPSLLPIRVPFYSTFFVRDQNSFKKKLTHLIHALKSRSAVISAVYLSPKKNSIVRKKVFHVSPILQCAYRLQILLYFPPKTFS